MIESIDFNPSEIGYMYSSLNPETCDACIWRKDCTYCKNHLIQNYPPCKEFMKRIFSLIRVMSSRTDTQLACNLCLIRIEQSEIGNY
jgi:hypothetical protein